MPWSPFHTRIVIALGRIDIAVNGTDWGGAILGTLGTLLFLHVLSPQLGWRLAFVIGPVLGLVILLVRRNLPESPRWQLMHGKAAEAEQTIEYIEREVASSGRQLPPVDDSRAIEIRPAPHVGSDPFKLFVGYLIGAGGMVLGGAAEIILGVAAEGKSLEDVAHPLSLVRKATSSASHLAQEGTRMHKHAF